MLADVGLEPDRVAAMLDGVYSATVVNNILERERRKGQHMITDPVLLRKIIMFLADNIGSNVSAASIGNTLTNEALHTTGRQYIVDDISMYIEARQASLA